MNNFHFSGMFVVLLLTALGASPSRAADQAKDDAKRVAADNNAFAFDLYAKIREQKGNLFFSPAGISTALAMTYAGERKDGRRDGQGDALHAQSRKTAPGVCNFVDGTERTDSGKRAISFPLPMHSGVRPTTRGSPTS